ncbi:MAG: hypothetical protein ACI86C_001307 [Candidatus Latescibacterota bacterium]|jgi:hypothetical protein
MKLTQVETGQSYMTALSKNNILNNSYKRLSVQVSLTGLSFLVSHQDTKDAIFFTEKNFDRNYTPEELLFEIQHHIAREPVLTDNFASVSIVYATNMFAVVPAALFDETKLSDYLKFNAKILANDFMTYDSLSNHDMVVVYVPFVNINNYFFDHYGEFQYFHSSSVLLKTILDSEKHGTAPKVFIHIRKEQFDFIVLDKGQLQLCNAYAYKTPEDYMYYVLFCLEQLNLNPDSIETYLIGDVNKTDALYEISYRYIRNISFYKASFEGILFTESDLSHQHFLLKNS